MNSETTVTGRIPTPIAGKLRGLRLRVVRWFLVDGLNRLLAALFALIAVDFALDRYFVMDRAQRTIMLLLALGVLAWVVWRFLLRPLTARVSDQALCREVERRHPELAEKLISAVEFSGMDFHGKAGVSRALVTRAIDEGGEAVGEIDFGEAVREDALRRNRTILVILAAGFVVLLVGIQVWNPMSIWFERNVLLRETSWPQDFSFEVVGAEDRVLLAPRGDDWPIVARIAEGHRRLPESVGIEFRGEGQRRVESMAREEDGREFRYQAINLLEPFEFRMVSGRIKSEWHEVRLIDRPSVASLRLIETPASYTGLKPRELPPERSPQLVLAGSGLEIEGESTMPLALAKLKIGESEFPFEIVGGNRFRKALAPTVVRSGACEITLGATERVQRPGEPKPAALIGREPVRLKIRVVEDKAPEVKLKVEGVGSMLVAKARIPYLLTVRDGFAVTSVVLESGWRPDKEDVPEKQESRPVAEAGPGLGKPQLEVNAGIELKDLGVTEGARLSLQFKAVDNNTASGPGVGVSPRLLFRVVGVGELLDDLLRREGEQRQVLQDLIRRQDQLLTECQALQAESREISELPREQEAALVKLQKRQKLMVVSLRPVVSSLRGLAAEIVNNRLEEEGNPALSSRLLKIAEPLEKVTEEAIPAAALDLDRARRAAAQADGRNLALDAADSRQQAIIQSLKDALTEMQKNEGFQQVVNLLYEISRTQNSVREMTEKERIRRIRELLGEEPEK